MTILRQKQRYIPGDNYIICQRCGFKTRASQSKYTHDGLLVCLKDWEPEHPADKIHKIPPERIAPRKNAPEPTDKFVTGDRTAEDL